ncbi:GNAT family N-acetyltransferase [Aspergillus ibericus CBS 121593]|uniref:Acyl-CoA N-acyltransferase n=1 Tax=Aspergillus ibericus CBS 121593 TaxID=1448316 RepID=A0A395HCF5_9EURO|nr:acyl-CoA N-acyltransferase [Aspergillus ibericus CBS 121593]RAL05482.1 acyl-CoA N-acyltransferase [Aspergillus ibericus CBS 121593]
MTTPSYQIIPATTPTHITTTRTLFLTYAQWLNIDLSFQNFDAELSSLPGKYAPPDGEILLAYSTSSPSIPLGCIALRPLPDPEDPSSSPSTSRRYCEVKRLWVAPEARRMGLGRALVDAIMARAKELGYREMRLDTLRSMEGPVRLYKSLGFVEIEPYYDATKAERFKEMVFLGRDLWV